jgi:hypothetical protein
MLRLIQKQVFNKKIYYPLHATFTSGSHTFGRTNVKKKSDFTHISNTSNKFVNTMNNKSNTRQLCDEQLPKKIKELEVKITNQDLSRIKNVFFAYTSGFVVPVTYILCLNTVSILCFYIALYNMLQINSRKRLIKEYEHKIEVMNKYITHPTNTK